MDNTAFFQLLNAVKDQIEGMRPWMQLRKVDSSKTALASDTQDTAKALPTRFLRTFSIRRRTGRPSAMMLKSSDDDVLYYDPIPFGSQEEYRDVNGRFFVDIAGSNFYLTGEVDKTYTIYLNYIQGTVDIAAGTEWSFPERFHTIPVFLVAEINKGGIDYDDINLRQAIANSKTAQDLLRPMIFWDDQLQRNELGI